LKSGNKTDLKDLTLKSFLSRFYIGKVCDHWLQSRSTQLTGTTTLSIMTLSIMAFSIMTFSIMALSIRTLSIITIMAEFSLAEFNLSSCRKEALCAECRYAGCRSAECRGAQFTDIGYLWPRDAFVPWFLGHRDKKIEIILIIMQPKEPLQVQVSLAFLIDENAVKIASVNAP
jgi:hypothetical protein